MTTRTDVTVDFRSSPRAAEVAAPSVQMTMQDLVDTLRKLEDQFTEGVSFSKLLNASGKEELGGGVKVGITVALQNLLLAFEGRTTPAQVGTVTGSPANPIDTRLTMQDSAATFVTNGVTRGSLLVNFTDQSVAEVYRVNSETEIETKLLVEGIGNTYDNTDVYKIWNIVQCNATGGNLVALDDLGATLDSPILPTAFTQVILTSSSSATLSEQADIQFSSYSEQVFVNPDSPNSSASIDFPSGTRRQPAETFSQALIIAADVGLNAIAFRGTHVLPVGPVFDDLSFIGDSESASTLSVPAGVTANNCEYENMMLTGTLDGESEVVDCSVGNLSVFSGDLHSCGLTGTITLAGGAQTSVLNCYSRVAGGSTPVIDMGGSGQSLIIRGYEGGIELQNKTGSDECSIDMSSGQIVLNDTVTTGTLWLRGVATWTNRSTYAGGATIEDELLDGKESVIMRKIMRNKMITDPVTGILTVYDDDGVTVLIQANIYEDTSLAQAYRGRGMEVRERLE